MTGGLHALICHSAFAKLFAHPLFRLVSIRSLKTAQSCRQSADEETETARGPAEGPVTSERREKS